MSFLGFSAGPPGWLRCLSERLRVCIVKAKKRCLNNLLLSDNGISCRGAHMQKAIWKGILVPVSFYYAGRCHVCNEAECRWQSGRNGSLILTMINEQRWKMNYAPLLEGRNILCENVNFACQPAGKPGESGGEAGG